MTASERLIEAGYEDVIILSNYSYDDALIGVTDENRAVYSYEKMVDWLCKEENMDEEEAIDWINYKTIRALPYAGGKGPIVVYSIP